MKKKNVTLFSIVFLLCVFIVDGFIAVDAADNVLDVLEIPSRGTSVTSTIALQDGVSYEIVVSGSYYTGGTPIINYAHDAMYATQDNWITHTNDQNGLYIDKWSEGSKQWGVYNSEHIYRYTIVGNGSKISFKIHDTSHSDNSGSLTVQILGSPITPQTPTPTPTSTTSTPETTPESINPTPNNTHTNPTPSDNTSITSPTSTSPQTNTTPTATKQPGPFENTFVIITTLIVTATATTILIFTLKKNK